MKLALIAAALLISVSPALAELTSSHHNDICMEVKTPPKALQREPNVPYVVRYAHGVAGGICHHGIACAGQYAPGKWVIWIDADMTDREKRCVLLHEKAHLPPNNWNASHGRAYDKPKPFHPRNALPAP